MPRVRRVVTGHGEAGKAVVVSDTDVQPTDPQFAPKWSIWSADAPVVLPNGGARPDFTGPLIPEPWRVPRLVLTLLAYFNPPACSTPPTRPGRHRLPAHRPPARWRWLPTPTPPPATAPSRALPDCQLAQQPRGARGHGRRGHRRRAQGRPAPHVVGQAFATRRRAGYRLSTMDRLPIPYGGTAASVRRGGLRAMPEATAASHPHPHKAPRLGPRSTA